MCQIIHIIDDSAADKGDEGDEGEGMVREDEKEEEGNNTDNTDGVHTARPRKKNYQKKYIVYTCKAWYKTADNQVIHLKPAYLKCTLKKFNNVTALQISKVLYACHVRVYECMSV